jgi:hypothetical protein
MSASRLGKSWRSTGHIAGGSGTAFIAAGRLQSAGARPQMTPPPPLAAPPTLCRIRGHAPYRSTKDGDESAEHLNIAERQVPTAYRDEHGKAHARHFDRKVDAQRGLNEITAAMVTGTYVDPSASCMASASTTASGPRGKSGAPGTEAAMGSPHVQPRLPTSVCARCGALTSSTGSEFAHPRVRAGHRARRANNVRAVRPRRRR